MNNLVITFSLLNSHKKTVTMSDAAVNLDIESTNSISECQNVKPRQGCKFIMVVVQKKVNEKWFRRGFLSQLQKVKYLIMLAK